MFFNPIKEINRLRKEINMLLRKGMSNIYFLSDYWQKLTFSKFDFLSLTNLSPGQLLRSSDSRRFNWIFKLIVAILKSEVWEQNCMWLFYQFTFERNYDVLKTKNPCILLNKKQNGIENRKSYTQFYRDELCLSSYKNRKSNVKLW